MFLRMPTFTSRSGRAGTRQFPKSKPSKNTKMEADYLSVNSMGKDFSKSPAARTVTTAKIDPPATIKYNPNVVTMTNKVQPYTSDDVISLTAA